MHPLTLDRLVPNVSSDHQCGCVTVRPDPVVAETNVPSAVHCSELGVRNTSSQASSSRHVSPVPFR